MSVEFSGVNIMPGPDPPDDFREEQRSVRVGIPNLLLDPQQTNLVCHEYMDQPRIRGRRGIRRHRSREHHPNAYGLMPSPNIIAPSPARKTSRAAICAIGNSIALGEPPIRVGEEFEMLDVVSGGRRVADFAVDTPLDGNFCDDPIPTPSRDEYPRPAT
jgi:hypothetical protein